MRVLALVLVPLLVMGGSEASRILAAVPFPALSHQLPLRTILLELARRGHSVTFITTNPLRKKISNYTEIDISASYNYLRTSFDWMSIADWTPIEMVLSYETTGARVCEEDLETPEMKSFIKSAGQFDLVILERLLTPCFYGLAHVVGSPPVVGYMSHGAAPHTHLAHGNPSNPAYLPDTVVGFSDHMSFWERLYSAYLWLRIQWSWYSVILPLHDQIQRKYFGPKVPSLFEVERNFSLVLINNHFSVCYPRPNLPNMIELTGLQVEPSPKPLPEDLQDWLNGAADGVVYFSLGSTVQAISMTEQKRRAFLDAFRQLPQRVLWKWEADNATDLPINVKLAKWLPQQAVLAHPNVRLFITQGGLQSFNEAAYHGVPLIGIPVLGDQHYNVAKMVTAGVGLQLKYKDVTADSVLSAVREVIGQQRYQQNMRRFSAVYREHQAESLPKAIWWIEYVLRHNGAPHMRSAAVDLSWYQLLLVDVAAFGLAAVVATATLLYFLIRLLMYTVSKTPKLKRH